LREYELVVLYHPDLEADMTKALEKVSGIITGAKGKIIAEDDWGRRKLAYKIADQDFAVYRVYTLELPASAPKIINDALNITNEALRFLLTAVDPKVKALIDEEKAHNREEEQPIKEVEEQNGV
jgi:small subunit ribosomal protein S6